MTHFITEEELLELRKILEKNEGENECIACGICCKISGKYFIDIEQKRISKKYSDNFFSKEQGINVIKSSDYVPWCLGGKDPQLRQNLYENESFIITPEIQIGGIDSEPWFQQISCKVYQERPILCRFYPYNSFPYYCMIGIEFNGNNPKEDNRFLNLMAKYLYSYRWEIINNINSTYISWRIKKSDQINISKQKKDGTFVITNSKSLRYQNSIWNLWVYQRELKISQEEKKLLILLDGSRTAKNIIDSSTVPSNYLSWKDLLMNWMIFELIEFPDNLLELLLDGLVRF